MVIKNLESVYTLHGREDDWIKVKPEYMDSLGEEVDVCHPNYHSSLCNGANVVEGSHHGRVLG